MKIREFKYSKTGEETKSYSVMVLNENESHMQGIAVNYLSDIDKQTLFKLQEDYEKALQPYMTKAFRQFLKSKIQE